MKHKDTKPTKEESNALSFGIIGAAIEVHRALGPGLLESAYEECLAHELSLRKIPFRRQVPLPIPYKGVRLDAGYRMDLVVKETIILELKAVEHVAPIHKVQLLTHLRFFGLWLGLLINFHVPVLQRGIHRVVS
jgi:GxxExxY protein